MLIACSIVSDIIERSGELIPTEEDTESEHAIPTTSCENCQNPATETCNGCRGAPIYDEYFSSVYYCSKRCQEAHWTSHKVECKKLKQRIILQRAAGLLNAIWRVLRNQLWDVDVESVSYDEENHQVVLHEGNYSSFTDGRIFHIIPRYLRAEVVGDKSQKYDRAVTWDGYDKAMFLLTDLARTLLEG
jgi:hypothetical protein